MKPITLEEAQLLHDLGVAVYWEDRERKDFDLAVQRPGVYVYDSRLLWSIDEEETE